MIINVLLGKSDAAAVFLPEMNNESAETRRQLREVVETPQIAPHPLSANPRVPAKVRDAVAKAIIAIGSSQTGADMLKRLRLGDPVPADYAKDYAPLEVMDIKKLTDWGQ